jgi:hypothetical protein
MGLPTSVWQNKLDKLQPGATCAVGVHGMGTRGKPTM